MRSAPFLATTASITRKRWSGTTETVRRNGWQNNFVSAYATTHPWEDFAESFAHALHIVDTLETATSFGLLRGDTRFEAIGDPYRCSDGQKLADAWVPLTLAVNAIHRSMGQRDFYPFVLTSAIVKKLDFVFTLLLQPRNDASA